MQLINGYISKIVYYASITMPVYFLVRLLYIFTKKKKTTFKDELVSFLFWIYVVSLITLTILISLPKDIMSIFPLDFNGKINTNTFLVFTQSINLLKSGNYKYFIINVLGNVFAFIPMGIFIPLLNKNRKVFEVLMYGFLTSLFIEIVQLVIFRATDVDDIMLNTIGTLLGYLIYRFIMK